MADSQQTYPAVKIEKFRIKGIQIDPLDIVSLDIYESINFPGITGRLILQDYGSFKELRNIFAGDSFEIIFGRAQDKPLDFNLTICESYGDDNNDDDLHNTVAFGFCSSWLINGFTKKRSRPYTNKRIDEIITDILVRDCDAKPGIIIPTKTTLERFVSPYNSPIATIRYLMNFAIDENDNGGYLIWTEAETDTVNFIPVSRLMHRTDFYGQAGIDLTMNPSYARSSERIYQQKMDQSFDIMRYSDLGMGRSRFIGFNYDTSEIMSSDKKIDEYDHNHLSTKLPLNDKFTGRQFRTTKNSYLYPNTNELILEKVDASRLIDGRLNTKYSLMFSDIIKINMLTTGENFHKRVGRQIKVRWSSPDEGKTGDDKQFTGTYLIRNIRHTISGMEYANIVTVVADGYKVIDRSDMVNWDGKFNEILPGHDGDLFDVDDESETIQDTSVPELIS